jgi:hypothetical protein
MPFYRYLEDADVHVVDCAGKIDLELGLARLEALARELAARPALRGPRKLLIDFRNAIWESAEVHMQLSVTTRRDFGLNGSNDAIRVAFLDVFRNGPVAGNEHWFTDEAEALQWLRLA